MLTARADLQTCEWEQWLSLPGLPGKQKKSIICSGASVAECISLVTELESPT